MRAFRMIFVVLSMILAANLVSGEGPSCKDCECENQECRLNNLKERKKETLEELIGLFQRKLDVLHHPQCSECGETTPSPTPPRPSTPPSRPPTPPPPTCAKDYDCLAECQRQPDPSKATSTILSCQGCCKLTCADWQPKTQCGKCGRKVKLNALRTEIDLGSSPFRATCDVCCEDLTGAPTAAPLTCKDWAPDNCSPLDGLDPDDETCPNGKVLNPAFEDSQILDCAVCTQPTCTQFKCTDYPMVQHDEHQCNVLLHPHVCCKPTCELFDCRAHNMVLDETKKTSTIITRENCCTPTCTNWPHHCEWPTVFDRHHPNTPLNDYTDGSEGQEKCCIPIPLACDVLPCPPGLVRCTTEQIDNRTCAQEAQKFRRDICINQTNPGGCQDVHRFSLWGVPVWECCKCSSDGHIPAFDDDDQLYHCLELPEREEHFYCQTGLCRITIAGKNYCIGEEEAIAHGYHCDEEWKGDINAPADAGPMTHAKFDHSALGLDDKRHEHNG